MRDCIFTSESVTPGHPDKVCDRISDAVLDACLSRDSNSRVACECFATGNFLLVGGEISSKAVVDVAEVAKQQIKDIGYTEDNLGFSANSIKILNKVAVQSPDIALGVNTGGAGDQGIMFGYACTDTPDYMPAPIYYAHRLAEALTYARKQRYSGYLKPDGKTQVSVRYDTDGKVAGIDTILLSTQHRSDVTIDDIKHIVKSELIPEVFPIRLISKDTKVLVNPTGRFVIGGPVADTGLTGRKIIVDSYGGYSRHGGGCWSGKDPTKVDRSASYMARYLAKNLMGSEFMHSMPFSGCEIQLAYAIGVKEPVSVCVNLESYTDIDSKIVDDVKHKLIKAIRENIDLTPLGIIDRLHLRNIKYTPLTAFGHMGRDASIAPWEKLDCTEIFNNL